MFRIQRMRSVGTRNRTVGISGYLNQSTPLKYSPALWLSNTAYKQTVGGSAASVDGDPVGEWVDQSGNTGRNVVNATAGNRGTLKTNIINGLSVVRFDGISQFLASAAFTLDQPFTRVSVFQQRTYTSGHIFNGIATNCCLYQDGLNPRLSIFAGVTNAGSVNVPLNTFCVLAEVFNGASSFTVLNNGTPSAMGNPGANNPGGLTIAAFRSGIASWTAIDVAEVAMYPSALASGTGGPIDVLSNYMKSKYGIT